MSGCEDTQPPMPTFADRGRLRWTGHCVPNAVSVFLVIDFSGYGRAFRLVLFTVVSPNSLHIVATILQENGAHCDPEGFFSPVEIPNRAGDKRRQRRQESRKLSNRAAQ